MPPEPPATEPPATEPPAAGPPAEIGALARRRAQVRADRDYALADALRQQIADRGWQVADSGTGYALQPAPPYPLLAGLADLPQASPADPAAGRVATVALLVQGWPDDLR
ncbi:MAG: hypothetical protein ACLP52_31485, partial [Streptosporangiaceae bacterium]